MLDEAILFLFYRKKYKELLEMVRQKYQKEKDSVVETQKGILSAKAARKKEKLRQKT